MVASGLSYQHQDASGESIDLPVGKVVCVGRNYLDHIQELNNAVPEQALLFIKPATALCTVSKPVFIPKDKGACHNELELAVLINKPLCKANQEQALGAIWGIGLALDLTLRDVQDKLKSQGQPWERAKAFDGSCPVSGFVSKSAIDVQGDIAFSLDVNGLARQRGNSELMIRDIPSLLVEASHCFSLLPGDILLTGTPKGVGPLHKGDALSLSLAEHFTIHTAVN